MKRLRRLIILFFVRFIQAVRIFIYKYFFSDCSFTLNTVKLNQPVRFCGKGKVILNDCEIGVYSSPFFTNGVSYIEARHANAFVKVGAGTCINNTFSAIAYDGGISIGKRCLIGTNVTVINSDFHSLNYLDRGNKKIISKDVVVKDDVFIGNDVTILKGVIVGCGAVIGCGSIVLNDVLPATIVAGNPAVKIRDVF